MRQKNNGRGESNILQNQFTAYLATAIRWQKIAYLRNRAKLTKHELPTDLNAVFVQELEMQAETASSPESLALDSIALAQALEQLSERDRRIFLARAMGNYSFEELAAELGLGYKGVAAAYYRAIQKLKQEL